MDYVTLFLPSFCLQYMITMIACMLKAALLITFLVQEIPPNTSVRIQCSFCSLSDHVKNVAVTCINWYKTTDVFIDVGDRSGQMCTYNLHIS